MLVFKRIWSLSAPFLICLLSLKFKLRTGPYRWNWHVTDINLGVNRFVMRIFWNRAACVNKLGAARNPGNYWELKEDRHPVATAPKMHSSKQILPGFSLPRSIFTDPSVIYAMKYLLWPFTVICGHVYVLQDGMDTYWRKESTYVKAV